MRCVASWDDLRAQLSDYDALRAGQVPAPELASYEDLPNALIRARIAAGLTQRDLAERLGIPEQQVQRYEATEYTQASFARLREVMAALTQSTSLNLSALHAATPTTGRAVPPTTPR